MLTDPCADPGIFARVVQARLPENSSDNVFCLFLSSTFTVLQWLINGLFQRKLKFYNVSGAGGGGAGPTYSRGGGGGAGFCKPTLNKFERDSPLHHLHENY